VSALAAHGDVLAMILASTGLIVWLDARTRRAFRPMEASIVRIDARLEIIGARLDARLKVIEARFAAMDAKKNGGDHVAVDNPHLIEQPALRN
jgi:hypothetical protein